MLGTEIEPLDGAECETRQKSGESHWWYIRDSEVHWVHVSPDHRFYDHEGYPKQAQDVEVGDIIVHRLGNFEVIESGRHDRIWTRVQVIMPRVHLYWANGFLSHA